MAINKVVLNGETVLDLTGTTVTGADLPNGVTAVDKSGAIVTGTTPKIHSASGTFLFNGTPVNYSVADDVVNIYTTTPITIADSGNSATLPDELDTSYYRRYGQAKEVTSDSAVFTNRAYVQAYNKTISIIGAAAGSTVEFNLTYVLS